MYAVAVLPEGFLTLKPVNFSAMNATTAVALTVMAASGFFTMMTLTSAVVTTTTNFAMTV